MVLSEKLGFHVILAKCEQMVNFNRCYLFLTPNIQHMWNSTSSHKFKLNSNRKLFILHRCKKHQKSKKKLQRVKPERWHTWPYVCSHTESKQNRLYIMKICSYLLCFVWQKTRTIWLKVIRIAVFVANERKPFSSNFMHI